jgi:hypothetical protein
MALTERPADRRPLAPLTGDSTLGAVIAVYLGAGAGDADGRELRSALSHVDAELGMVPVRQVRSRHVADLLENLSDAGLSPRRRAAVVDALHAVFAFAMARGLVSDDPTPRRATHRRPSDAPPPEPARTPTLAMVALGARVALWTTWFIVVGFLVLLIALLVEFG